MVYRKGELSKGTIDRDWPHQVALPAARYEAGVTGQLELASQTGLLRYTVLGFSKAA